MSSSQKQPNGRRHTTCGTQGEQELPIKPAWQGYIKNSVSACVLMTAALKGFVQHMPRRPGEGERAELIKSGNIFIYHESVSNIRRWTDGLNWSPSRILGNFLVYRELSEPFPAGQKKKALKKHQNRNASRAEAKAKTTNPLIPEEDMRKLVGSLTDSYDFKEDGLVKKTISITIKGQTHHIVSYYKPMDVYRKKLYDVCDDPFFHDCAPPLEMLNPTAFRTEFLEEIVTYHREVQNLPPETLIQLGLQQQFFAIPSDDHNQQFLLGPQVQPQQQVPIHQNQWATQFEHVYNGSQQQYYSCMPQAQHHQPAMLQSAEDPTFEAHGHQQALSRRLAENPHIGQFDPQTIPRQQSFSMIEQELGTIHTFPQTGVENNDKRGSVAAMTAFDDVNYHGLPDGNAFYVPTAEYNTLPAQQGLCAFDDDLNGLKLEDDLENVNKHHDWSEAL